MKKMMKNYAIMVSLVGFVLIFNMAESATSTKSASATAPAVDCASLALTMADCRSFVTSGSTVQKPEGACCSGLKTTLKIDAECLCEGFKNSAQFGITLNVSKALGLPAACHVSASSVSDCGMNINLNGAPAAAPTASSPSSAAAPPTGSGTTEVAAPPPPGSSGSSTTAAISVVVVGPFVAYCSILF